jgi:hypothetical protein
MQLDAFNQMDQWLTKLKADTRDQPLARKVRRSKPATAFDFCLLSSDVTQSTKVTEKEVCDADPFLKPSSSPRQAAGGSLSENILKCRLTPLNSADYAPIVFTPAQWGRLQAAFPEGVCDWDKRGVGQRDANSPRTFEDGPGGKPLGRAPSSHEHDSHHGHGHDWDDHDRD